MGSQIDFLEAQLAMATAALETARRLQRAAEEQRNLAVDQLRAIAASLLSTEWNTFLRDHPDAIHWSPEQLGAWIIDTGVRKLNRLQLVGIGDPEILEALVQERDALREENEGLRQQLEQKTREYENAQERVSVLLEENRMLREELERLNQRIAALSVQHLLPSDAPIDQSDSAWIAEWQTSPDYVRGVEALRILGQNGYVLRESIARALGINARAGATLRLFEHLREWGLIEERPAPPLGIRGRTPNLVYLTRKGQEAFRKLFGQEPVEPEDQRLLRRHKSQEQAMLALQARFILEEHGAESVDLFPAPQALPDGGTFEVDLVAIVNGRRLFIELEMVPRGLRRIDKWNRYAQLTREFYFFVPNREALGRLVTELNYWAYRSSSFASGVVIHVCQVSQVSDDELWTFVRPLGSKGAKEA